MAEAVLSALMEVLFQKTASHIFQKTGLFGSTKKEMLKLQSTLSTIQAVLQDAEDRQMKDKALKNWLLKLKDIVYEADDLLDEYMTDLLRHKVILDHPETRYCVLYAASYLYLNGAFLFMGCRLNLKLKEVGEKLDLVANERAKFHFRDIVCQKGVFDERRPQSDSYVIESKVFGRNKDKENMIKLLVESSDVSVVSIVGIGGIGKTTVAKLVYNDAVVENIFDTRIWVCVSEGFDVKRLLKAIVESATGSSCNLVEMDVIQRRVQELILGKKFLLVLDDVWDDDHEKYERLKNLVHNGLDGSKILVTTRNEKVALLMGTKNPYRLEGLPDDDCWSLFRELAYKNRQKELLALEEVGKEIAKKCRGVPLAAKALGSLMCLKNQKSEWSFIRDCEMWDLMGHEDGAGVLSALRLTYEYLPAHLKQCFAYCSIFPKGYRINKNTLICLWMAEGFLPSSECMPPEEVGNDCFNELLWRSFFQNVRRDFDGNIVEINMHDLVHDLAKSVGGVDCLTTEYSKEIIPVATRHLSVLGNGAPKKLGRLRGAQKLRSFLLLDGQRNIAKLSKSFFLSFKSVRALDCSGGRIKKLSKSVGTLLHLRYLNLSQSLLKTLPKSICCLLNLEALILKHCNHLIDLPEDIRKLVNLRHLDIYGCTSLNMLPVGIGQMRSLQTLPVYVVNNTAASGISELQRLDLRGELMIKNLEHLSNEICAKTANLKGKKHIRFLKLIWEVDEMGTRENVERVIEGLQPNSDLRKLHIEGYIGANFPSWLMNIYLVHIVELWLLKCPRCVELPQLGKLPFLEVLTVDGMDSAMYFCNSSCEKDRATQFASLKQLTLRNMPNLLGWSVNEDHDVLPCLKKFTCEACPYLKNLPDLPSLESLELTDCSSELLAVTAVKITSLTHLMISGCLDLLNLPEGLLENNIHLLSVEIRNCPELQSLSCELKVLPGLESLSISNCNNLSSVLDSCGLETLKSLSIHGCQKISLEKGLKRLQFLQYVSLSDCENLATLPVTMQHLTSLQTLHIWSCSQMHMLPEWLGGLISLRELELWYCENLSSVPESVKKLTKLQFLSIWSCPNLEIRCRKDVGEDWHKIKHVPFIKINGPYIQAMAVK